MSRITCWSWCIGLFALLACQLPASAQTGPHKTRNVVLIVNGDSRL